MIEKNVKPTILTVTFVFFMVVMILWPWIPTRAISVTYVLLEVAQLVSVMHFKVDIYEDLSNRVCSKYITNGGLCAMTHFVLVATWLYLAHGMLLAGLMEGSFIALPFINSHLISIYKS